MFTVIFINKNASKLLKGHRFLFEPFVKNGTLALCDWNESGTDINSAVPDIYDLIRGHKEWKAVIINTDSVEGKNFGTKLNPFDFSNFDSETEPHESPSPYIRLCHMLSGYNVEIVKEFEKGFEYFDTEKGEVVQIKEKDLQSDDELRELSDAHEDLKDVYIEVEIPAERKRHARELNQKYQFSDTRPYEVDLIATRSDFEGSEKVRIEESWKNHLEMFSSNFCEKNNYPNNCRFMAFDLIGLHHSLHGKQVFEFWLSVLTIATNRITASNLQAYRLYSLDVDVDPQKLNESFSYNLSNLEEAKNLVEIQQNIKRELSFGIDQEIVTREHISVHMDNTGSSELMVYRPKFGLSSDCPKNEISYWRNLMREKAKSLEKYLKEPRRAIDRSSNDAKERSKLFLMNSYELDRFQINDVIERKDELENDIVGSKLSDKINHHKMSENLRKEDKNVAAMLRYRMSRKVTLLVGLIALFSCFIGFVPYMVFSVRFTGDVLYSLTLVGIVMAVCIAGGLAALLYDRHKILKGVKKYNDAAFDIVMTVEGIDEDYSEYLSDVCTYMKAKAILDGIGNNTHVNDNLKLMLNYHMTELNNAIERDLKFLHMYDLKRKDYVGLASESVGFDIKSEPSDCPVYNLRVARDDEENDILVNENSGYRVNAPYDFISHMKLERVEIYEGDEDEY